MLDRQCNRHERGNLSGLRDLLMTNWERSPEARLKVDPRTDFASGILFLASAASARLR